MKELLLLFLIFLNCRAFGQGETLQSLNLTGPIESITTRKYSLEQSQVQGEWVALPKRLIEINYQEFDVEGRLLMSTQIDQNLDTLFNTVITYPSDKHILYTFFEGSDSVATDEYFLNEDVKNGERRVVLKRGKEYLNLNYRIRGDGKIVEIISKNEFDETISQGLFMYTSGGHLKRVNHIISGDTITTEFEYRSFDFNNNWLIAYEKKGDIFNGQLLQLRSITYSEKLKLKKQKGSQKTPHDFMVLLSKVGKSENRAQLDKLIHSKDMELHTKYMTESPNEIWTLLSSMVALDTPLKIGDTYALVPIEVPGSDEIQKLLFELDGKKWCLVLSTF